MRNLSLIWRRRVVEPWRSNAWRRRLQNADGVVAAAGMSAADGDATTIASLNFFGVRDLIVALHPLLKERPKGAQVVVVASVAAGNVPDIPGDLVHTLLTAA